MKSGHVYRFSDRVAATLFTWDHDGLTVYMSASEAFAYADALRRVASEIECRVPFAKSTISTTKIGRD